MLGLELGMLEMLDVIVLSRSSVDIKSQTVHAVSALTPSAPHCEACAERCEAGFGPVLRDFKSQQDMGVL